MYKTVMNMLTTTRRKLHIENINSYDYELWHYLRCTLTLLFSIRHFYTSLPPFRLAASVLWCLSWEKEGRAV